MHIEKRKNFAFFYTQFHTSQPGKENSKIVNKNLLSLLVYCRKCRYVDFFYFFIFIQKVLLNLRWWRQLYSSWTFIKQFNLLKKIIIRNRIDNGIYMVPGLFISILKWNFASKKGTFGILYVIFKLQMKHLLSVYWLNHSLNCPHNAFEFLICWCLNSRMWGSGVCSM